METTDNTVTMTEAILRAGMSRNGSWGSKQLALLGVTGKTKTKGWRLRLWGQKFPKEVVDQFLSLKDAHLTAKTAAPPIPEPRNAIRKKEPRITPRPATTKRVIDEAQFSPDQQAAVQALDQWRGDYSAQMMTMGGLAGTGKTSLIAYLVGRWGNCAVAALAGKAAYVLRRKGILGAQTIHSLIYVPEDDGYGNIVFRKVDFLPDTIHRIIVDEASMVSTQLARDILSFGLPVLFVGDHGQLEPIGDDPGLLHNPDARLEKIHRQAADNPILRFAHAVREGDEPRRWMNEPDQRLIVGQRRTIPDILATEHRRLETGQTQVICGYNKTRHGLNSEVRRILGYDSPVPEAGERIIFLRNNRTFGVFNGQQATVLRVEKPLLGLVDLEVLSDGDDKPALVTCLVSQFGTDLDKQQRRDDSICLADFGYAITAHKAQGSEWDRVIVLEELSPMWCSRRWRYTTATRAADQLTYLV